MKIKCPYCGQKGNSEYCRYCGHALPESEQNETDTSKILLKLIEENRFNDALWILKNVSSTEQLCRVAVFAAKQVLPERSNDAPRKAIAAAELAIANPTEENKRAAAEAAAEAAARAASDADVYAAVYAADCAADCAAAEAAEAAADAARKEMQLKIINYAIEVLGL